MNIIELLGKQKAYTFAKISKLAYEESPSYYSFQSRKIAIDSNVAFVLYNDHDIVVVCRGTELTDIGDVRTDANVKLIPSLTGTGLGHTGFETAAKAVWPHILVCINEIKTTQNVWFTGHSLGAAMSHLLAVLYTQKFPNDNVMLYTFGSPRVGNKHNTALGQIEHHRYVDGSDVVPRIPFLRYKHFGTLHYLNHAGVEVDANWFTMIKDRAACFVNNPAGAIQNHFIDRYVEVLGKLEV